MAKIAIVSDVHLGTRQYGISERYDDFLTAFMDVGDSVIRMKPDALIIGGDLFDSPRPDAKSVLLAKEVVSEVKRNVPGIRVLAIDGNHDLSNGLWHRVIGAEPFDDFSFAEVKGVSIRGLNYRNGRDLVAELQRLADECATADILVMHFALAEMNGGGSADTGVQELSPILEKTGVKAVLMGHVHIPDCRRWNGVMYVNPGSTEMKSVNEPQEKYFYVLDTDTWTAEPVPIKTRKVKAVEVVDETSLSDLQRTMEAEAKRVANGEQEDRPLYQVIADDTIDARQDGSRHRSDRSDCDEVEQGT